MMLQTLIRQVIAAREAGHVERCHTVPHRAGYSVGRHSYDALSLLLLLHPEPSVRLIKAVLWHDAAERWVGDLPTTVKWSYPALCTAYENAERSELQRHLPPAAEALNSLFEQDLIWLDAVDKIELWLWVLDEMHLGNQHVADFKARLEDAFFRSSRGDWLPGPAKEFLQQYGWQRLKAGGAT